MWHHFSVLLFLFFSLLVNLGCWNDTLMILIEGPEKAKLKKKMANAITRALLPFIWYKNWISFMLSMNNNYAELSAWPCCQREIGGPGKQKARFLVWNKVLHSVQIAQINISKKKDQCAFSNDETVIDLAAVPPGATASQSHASGAVSERTLWLTVSSLHNDFL